MAKAKFLIIRVEGTPEWMISFGDLLSCLLVFFILLLTFSSAKSGKIMDMIGESETVGAPGVPKHGALPGEAGKEVNTAVDPESLSPMNISDLMVSNIFLTFKGKIFSMGFSESVTVRDLADGIAISVPRDKIFVADTDTELSKEGAIMIEALANVVNSIGNELRILFVPQKDPSPKALENGAKQSAFIRDTLNKKYRISYPRMSYGSSHVTEQTPTFTFLIASRIDDKLMKLEDYLKQTR